MNINGRVSDVITVTTSPDDASVNEFLAMVDSRLFQGVNPIQVDCALLVRVTSSHINSLWLAREKCGHQGVALELINVSAALRRVLEALDLAGLFLPRTAAPLRFNLQLVPTAQDIDIAMSKVVEFLATSGVPDVAAFELQTIFYEVTTNILRYGQLTSEGSIVFDAQINEHVITFTFTDGGVSFDPTSRDWRVNFQKAGRELRRHGFGLAMIERLSDSLEYTRTADAKNQLKIKKVW